MRGPTLPISMSTHALKYRLENESFEQAMKRVASALKDDQPHFKAFREILTDMRFMPGGRVQSAMGSPREVTAYNCLSGDTEILTREYGAVPIREVAGKIVTLLDGNGDWVKCPVYDHGEQTTYVLNFKGGFNGVDVRSTLEHGWIQGARTIRTKAFIHESGKIEIDGLVPSKTIIDQEQYCAGIEHGIIYGDGSENDGHYTLRLCGEKIELFQFLRPDNTAQPPSVGDDVMCYYHKSGRTHFKQLPETSDLCYLRGFMRGWIATDGCVSVQPHATICCGPDEESWIRKWAPLIGWQVGGSTLLSPTTNYGERNKASRNLILRTSWMSSDDFLREKHRARWESGSTKTGTDWRIRGCYHTPRVEHVYCPVVPTTHSFALACGIHSANCFVSGPIEDTFVDGEGSIMGRATEAAQTMRLGGGIGYSFSTLRPRGDIIKSLDSSSSGAVSFMNIFDAVCGCVSSAGHRRGAQMGVLRVDHPDIVEFVNAKARPGAFLNFNFSVGITHKFIECLENDKPFPLTFGGKVYREIDAAQLWNQIMLNTWDWAEPGVLFIDTMNDMNNLWYCETISATNPCVTGDTAILTRTGYHRIDSLVGQSVDVWNGHEFSTVVPQVTGTDQETVLLVTSDGSELQCTPGHKFILSDGSRVQAKELRPGDKLAKHSWPVIETKDGLTDDLAYSQGFFAGDGWRDQRGRDYIGLWGKKRELVARFPSPVSVREYGIKGGYPGTDKSETKIYVYMGVERMRPKTFVPDASFTLDYRLRWLAGLIDSDGHITVKGSIQLSSKDRTFLVAVKQMLNTMGCSGQLSPMKDCYRLSISGSVSSDLRKHGLTTHRAEMRARPARDAARYVRVVSVTPSEKEALVYCFTEPKNHSGIFNGLYTAQCGEQPLPPFGACLLGSFNLVKYVTKDRSFDYTQLIADIPHVVRAMDNVIDRTLYPLPQQGREARAKRRMGLGVTGLANAIEAMGYAYGSEKFTDTQAHILATIRNYTYMASAELAAEKGAFALFNADKYLDGQFIKTLPEGVRSEIKKNGIRNSHLTSIAPTGTISLCADNVSSGIEPVFSYAFTRDIITSEGKTTEIVEDYGVRVFGVEGKKSDNVTMDEHLNVLITAQRYVDSAVSKTCNVPGTVNFDAFQKIYLDAYHGGAKGCTTFRKDGKRMGILRDKDEDEEVVEGTACTIDPDTGAKSCGD